MDRPVNEPEILAAVLRYQATELERDGELVLKLTEPLINGMLGRACTVRGVDFDDARSRIRLKVWRALKTYKPAGGRVFSYLNAVVQNHSRTICSEQLRDSIVLQPIEETDDIPVDGWRSAEAVEEIKFQLYSLRTICGRENERRAQRWLVRSLIQSEFSLPRHKLVRALRICFGVDVKSGRLIHDRTMLELRRVMLAGRTQFPRVNVSELRDKRERGLLKYRPFLCTGDFAKLCFLFRGLAPVIVGDLIEREMRTLNGEGTSERRREVIRKYLRAALDGFPDSVPLFPSE